MTFKRSCYFWLAILSMIAYGQTVSAQTRGSSTTLADEFNAVLNNISSDCAAASDTLNNQQAATCGAANNYIPRTDLEMRFAAPEELAAQKTMVKEFSAQQMANVLNRMTDLRNTKVARADGPNSASALVAEAYRSSAPLGGGASADGDFGRWSGFVNAAAGFGSRDQTAFEDKSDFNGYELTLGADYRVSESTVLGAALGYSDKNLKMKAQYAATGATNADAKVTTNGFAVTLYGQWEAGHWYANGSFGGQWMSHDMRRRADYFAGGPGAVQQLTANGSTNSSALQGSLSGGGVWNWGGTSLDTALNVAYTHSTMDGFQETGANCTTGACSGVSLNMRFDDATVNSLETSLSARLQHAFTPSSGVFVPFLVAEVIHQAKDQPYEITGMYASLYGAIPSFRIGTDEPDTQYYAAAAGFSFVGRGGWQSFLKYRAKFGLENVSDNVITAGLRREF